MIETTLSCLSIFSSFSFPQSVENKDHCDFVKLRNMLIRCCIALPHSLLCTLLFVRIFLSVYGPCTYMYTPSHTHTHTLYLSFMAHVHTLTHSLYLSFMAHVHTCALPHTHTHSIPLVSLLLFLSFHYFTLPLLFPPSLPHNTHPLTHSLPLDSLYTPLFLSIALVLSYYLSLPLLFSFSPLHL